MASWSALLLATALLHAQGPSLITSHSAYFPGEDIETIFRDGPGNAKDWVGIYPADATPGPVPSTRWLYVDGTQAGTQGVREGQLVFAEGLNLAGDWDAHLLLNDGYTILASTRFSILEPWATAVRTDKRAYLTGETIAVTFTNGPVNPKDWIGIYKAGQTPGSATPSTLWKYADGTTSGNTALADGTVAFAGGLTAPGDYVVHLLANDGYDIVASESFTVLPTSSATPRILSVRPADGVTGLPAIVNFTVTVTNGTSKVVPASVQLSLNGTPVPHQYAEEDGLIAISYANSTLFPPGVTNKYSLQFTDDAVPPNPYAVDVTVGVANYRNIVLPSPLYFENFDSTPEGELPTGWTQVSYTAVLNPDEDLGNLDSATYARWTAVNVDRFNGSFVTYSNPDNPESWATDYHRVLTVNPLNVLDGKIYDQPLASGRMAFGDSGYRNGHSQVLYLFSPDFDLTGKQDIHLSFHSLWEQNQDSMAAIEYSIDRGQTWLPIAYFLDQPAILTATNEVTGAVTVDAVTTLITEHGDVARYTDPDTGEEKGGMYGAFIGAEISPALAPYLQGRVNDDPAESKRIELFRLPQADNQAAVRLRFAHAGTDSWYFGVDDVGLYSIPESTPPPTLSITRSGDSVTISWPAGATGFTLESAPSLTRPAWANVPGVTGNSVTVTAAEAALFFRMRK